MKKLFLGLLSLLVSLNLAACTDYSNKISEERNQQKEKAFNEFKENIQSNLVEKGTEEVTEFEKNPRAKINQWLKTDYSKKTSSAGGIVSVKYNYNYDGDTYNFTVQKAYKSPTISLKKGEKITCRTLLIDTTEMKDKKSGKPQPYSKEAQNYAEQLLTKAKKIEMIYDKGDTQDKYGRELAYVRIDGKLLGEKLLERGLAKIAYIKAPNTKYLTQYKAAEKKAKKKQLNLWSK